MNGFNFPLRVDGVPPEVDLSVPEMPKVTSYKVQKGDNLSKIAAANGMKLSELLALNKNIKNRNFIKPGDSINLGAVVPKVNFKEAIIPFDPLLIDQPVMADISTQAIQSPERINVPEEVPLISTPTIKDKIQAQIGVPGQGFDFLSMPDSEIEAMKEPPLQLRAVNKPEQLTADSMDILNFINKNPNTAINQRALNKKVKAALNTRSKLSKTQDLDPNEMHYLAQVIANWGK